MLHARFWEPVAAACSTLPTAAAADGTLALPAAHVTSHGRHEPCCVADVPTLRQHPEGPEDVGRTSDQKQLPHIWGTCDTHTLAECVIICLVTMENCAYEFTVYDTIAISYLRNVVPW